MKKKNKTFKYLFFISLIITLILFSIDAFWVLYPEPGSSSYYGYYIYLLLIGGFLNMLLSFFLFPIFIFFENVLREKKKIFYTLFFSSIAYSIIMVVYVYPVIYMEVLKHTVLGHGTGSILMIFGAPAFLLLSSFWIRWVHKIVK